MVNHKTKVSSLKYFLGLFQGKNLKTLVSTVIFLLTLLIFLKNKTIQWVKQRKLKPRLNKGKQAFLWPIP